MEPIELRIDYGELDKALMALRGRMERFQPVMGTIARYLRRQTRINFERGGRPKKWEKSYRAFAGGHYGGHKEGKTLMDSGRLAMSIDWAATEEDAIVGTNVRYAAIHQFGGVIRAKGKALTIPISDIAKGRRARDFQDLFVFKSKTGAVLLVRNRGGRLEPLFALAKTVTIPARPFLVWLDEFDQGILRKLQKWILDGQTETKEG